MPANDHGSAGVASSSSSGLTGVGAAPGPASAISAASSTETALPQVGTCWRGKYEITAVVTETADVTVWHGRSVEGGHAVQLRAFRPVEPEIRAQVWSKVTGIDSPHVQHARDAQRVGDWRVEIADVPVGTPLHEWRAARSSVEPAVVKAIVTQIAEALGALHAFEIVHLGLKPDVIFVREAGTSLHCLLAGLDTLTTFDRKESIPAAVDPFYAPPEEVGLNVHVPGPGMCAWDWWSLGRVAQELILGRHVVGMLANTASRPVTAELRAQAETLLHEADSKAPRAGAVERMQIEDPQLKLLLRGLLTSSKDARWTGDNVDRWVRGQSVKEAYDTPRAETHFRWRGRPCTVPEIAGILQGAEFWAENTVQLFEPTTPGTLAHFLKWSQSLAIAHQQLNSAIELRDSLPLKLSSPVAQREAVTMVALLQLSAGKLVWRGRPFDSGVVTAMMAELGETDALMVLRALTTRSTALQVERIDQGAGRLLTEIGRTVGDVESLLKRYSWLGANDTEGAVRLFRLAVEPIPALRAKKDELAQKFAGSDHAAMEKIFKVQNPGRGELVVLAWASTAPEKFKFYTHVEAARRRGEVLRSRGLELIHALTWSQFERALAVGRITTSGWGWFIPGWMLVGAGAALLWPGPLGLVLTLVPGIVALMYRMVAAALERRALHEVVPDVRWTWRDGPGRCQRELRVAGRNQPREALATELEAVSKELASLTQVQPPPEPLPPLPTFPRVRLAGFASWCLVAAFVGVAGWRIHQHPVSVKDLKAAWLPAKPATPPPVAVVQNVKAEEKSNEVKVSWPFKAEDSAVKVAVKNTAPASAEQIAYATRHGRDLVAPYKTDTIGTLIILPVPAGDDVGAMLFDGKRGDLVNQQIYLLEYRPLARAWVEIGGRKGVFLDQ